MVDPGHHQPGIRRHANGPVGDGIAEVDCAAETVPGSIDPAAVAVVGQGAGIGGQVSDVEVVAIGIRGGGEQLRGGNGSAAVLNQTSEIDRGGDYWCMIGRDGLCQ